jgi:electron transfer DM13
MKKLLISVIALAVLAGGWYAFRPERLFVNQRVNESLGPSTASAGADAGSMAMSSSTEMAAEPREVASGMFHSGSHETAGTATIHEYADGRRVLRLTGFHTSNGPDVQVLLVAAADAKDNETVTKNGFIRVAGLKGNIGDQNYDLPAGVDLSKYRAVTIWCRRFGVNFGTAPLTAHS